MQISKGFFKNKPNLFAVISCIGVLIALAINLYHRAHYVSTGNAFIEGHFVALGARVKGTILKIWVEDQENVSKGQLLAQFDDRDFRNALDLATQSEASAQTQLNLAQKELTRSKFFFKRGYLSSEILEQSIARFTSAAKNLEAAQASREAARIDLNYTRVLAPADGVIAIRAAQPGMYLKVGTPLFGFVYPDQRWVIAKIKETDLSDVRIGSSVDVKIDALPSQTFSGSVLNISPATEGPFGAIPVDNASGNFTKYVQLVPVKIALNLSSQERELARVGLSAQISMRRP